MAISGAWVGVFLICLVAPLSTVYAAMQWEHRKLAEILDPRRASWAFLADPALVVAAAAFTAATNAAFTWSQWLVSAASALAVAIVGGVAIRIIDKPRYIRYGAVGSFVAASKLMHDRFTLPLLCGAVVSTGFLVLWEGAWNSEFWVGLSCIGAWLIGAVKDIIWEPNPLEQHPNNLSWVA